MDDDGIELDDIQDTVEIIQPTPWHNSDTVAASFMFAANISTAAAEHFRILSTLAVGQSAHEWLERDKEEFIEESMTTIQNLPEGGAARG